MLPHRKQKTPLHFPLRHLVSICWACCFWLAAGALRAQFEWPQLKFTEVAAVTFPVQVTHAGDGSGRLFMVSQQGRIHIYQDGQLVGLPFLDIESRVSSGGERGLFSVAFPPGYASKHSFYVAYSRVDDGAIVLSRFGVPASSPNTADVASEQVLLVVEHPSDNRNGGQLAFGPDGYLYFGLGDGHLPGDPLNNAQNVNRLLGKILRLDTENGAVPYAIPPTNPFVGVDGHRPEIWALGLRNPWRFSFDRETGDFYVADGGESEWEEINFEPSGSRGGRNYGWRIFEGSHPFDVPLGYDTSALTAPVIEYSHEFGQSIIGGFVYRGPPSRLSGIYLYADFSAPKVWGARREGGLWVTQVIDTSFRQFSSFGEGETGRLYGADYYQGKIFEISEDVIVRAPVLSPAGAVYKNDQVVYATSSTPHAIFRYTTNESEPTENDPLFPAAGLLLNAPTALKVKAFHAYLLPSQSTSASYGFSAARPTFSSVSGQIQPETGLTVFLSSTTANAAIRYTLDGSTPTETSALYGGPIHLEVGPASMRAAAFKTNYASSTVATASWTRPTLANPTIYPTNGRIYGMNRVWFTGAGGIHYTLDGTAPTEASPLFVDPFHVSAPSTLRARSFQYGYNSSAEVSVNLYLYNPESGSHTNGAGAGTEGYLNSALFNTAQFRSPEALCIDASGTLFICDTGNHAIRTFTPFGPVTTLAGNGTAGFVNAAGTASRLNAPRGICRDPEGNLYVADDGNHVIRKIDTAGSVTTYAGSGNVGMTDGPGPVAQFSDIQSVQLDVAGNLYVGSRGVIRKVDASRNVTTFATLPNPGRVAIAITPDGRLFATDASAVVYEIYAAGAVSVYAGGTVGLSDGDRTVARFAVNRSIASDALGILYVCDGDTVRKVAPNGAVYTMVGFDPEGGLSNLSGPRGLAVSSTGVAWIADTGNHRIRRAYPSDWERDGIPDDSEGGSTPFVVGVDDRLIDTDGDGQPNDVEYSGGSNPWSSSSRFQINSLIPNENGQMVVQWQSIANRRYRVFHSNDCQTWTDIGTDFIGTGGIISLPISTAGTSARFFKITSE